MAFLLQALYHKKLVKWGRSSHNTDSFNSLFSLFWGIIAELYPFNYSFAFHILVRIPQSIAIALAVCTLSPVIILMLTPAAVQVSTAVLTPGRHGSFRPDRPSKARTPLLFFSELNASTWIISHCFFTSSISNPKLKTAHESIAFSVGLPEISGADSELGL
ncbi:LOW QUALITY PROTEIN: hypothetical protein PanWU01x14_053940 [Parasponia andersonii]|uniref:Uncharacterized protein n=1 Tax=Parasponia andersonii TaxID=3476 RepID=A0A2P5DKL6_PARAD|nr:LOW QUALITY PROTEIN: hypothetical protein PanWU01x14_053940 [Parasponia andersonii]